MRPFRLVFRGRSGEGGIQRRLPSVAFSAPGVFWIPAFAGTTGRMGRRFGDGSRGLLYGPAGEWCRRVRLVFRVVPGRAESRDACHRLRFLRRAFSGFRLSPERRGGWGEGLGMEAGGCFVARRVNGAAVSVLYSGSFRGRAESRDACHRLRFLRRAFSGFRLSPERRGGWGEGLARDMGCRFAEGSRGLLCGPAGEWCGHSVLYSGSFRGRAESRDACHRLRFLRRAFSGFRLSPERRGGWGEGLARDMGWRFADGSRGLLYGPAGEWCRRVRLVFRVVSGEDGIQRRLPSVAFSAPGVFWIPAFAGTTGRMGRRFEDGSRGLLYGPAGEWCRRVRLVFRVVSGEGGIQRRLPSVAFSAPGVFWIPAFAGTTGRMGRRLGDGSRGLLCGPAGEWCGHSVLYSGSFRGGRNPETLAIGCVFCAGRFLDSGFRRNDGADGAKV